MKKFMAICIAMFSALAVFAQGKDGKDPLSVSGSSPTLPSLSKLYAGSFRIGVCVMPDQLKGPESKLILKQFNSITAENAMKPLYIAPAEGKYSFEEADAIVDFAQKKKIPVRGHTLVWHEQNAKWMFYDADGKYVSKEVLLGRLKDYITTVVSRYKGRIYAWDVVNEVVSQAGYRKSEWFDIAGDEYIEKAFAWAHAADPAALLFVNEIDTTERLKREKLYALVKGLLDKGVPVHGIGLQYHITLDYPSLPAMKQELDRFNELGIQIHITELDMSLNGDPNLKAAEAPRDLLVRQAHRYKEIFELFKRYKNITSVTLWGLHDGRSWLTYSPVKKPDWPLIFDKDLNTKLAFWGIADPSKLPPDVTITGGKKNSFIGYAKKGTPEIDGKEDAAWASSEEMPISIYIEGKGSTGSGRALWDDKNLYILVTVKDSTLSKKSKNSYEHDSAEIFVDERNNKSPEYLEDDAQYRLNFENEFSFRGNPAKFTSAALVTDSGYNIEIMIPFRYLKPEVGMRIGFDLQVNDDNGSGARTSYAKWNDPTNESFRNTSGFGTLVMEE